MSRVIVRGREIVSFIPTVATPLYLRKFIAVAEAEGLRVGHRRRTVLTENLLRANCDVTARLYIALYRPETLREVYFGASDVLSARALAIAGRVTIAWCHL